MRWAAYFSLVFMCMGCAPREIILTRSRLMMGHVPVNLSLRCPATQRNQAMEASEAAFQLAQKIESQISEWQKNSDLSCLNGNAGKAPCTIARDTMALLRRSDQLRRATDGAFDIRFASLSKAGQKSEIQLEERSTSAYLPHPQTRIGIGAIGKGWIVDAMLEYLRDQGFQQAIVDAGGDLRAMGGPWKIALQVPEGLPESITGLREITNRAIATSGLYEQGPHILDTATRHPVERKGSVSVETDRLADADALATAFFVMGEEKSFQYLEKFPGLMIYWTDPDGTVRSYGAKTPPPQAPK